jgi:hypothetical protein
VALKQRDGAVLVQLDPLGVARHQGA